MNLSKRYEKCEEVHRKIICRDCRNKIIFTVSTLISYPENL